MTGTSKPNLQQILAARYSDAPVPEEFSERSDLLHSMAARGSCRSFQDKPVPPHLLEVLCAIALASPTKSDLQQRDIILLQSPDIRKNLANLVSGQSWIADAPMILVFCGNNRRQRLLHEWHGVPFANDHLDAFFNATGDAAIALGAFVTAAEAVGLGCCPISAVRNEAEKVSALLRLPDHVFPFAGLAIGFPSGTPSVSKRLPMYLTCHIDHYQEDNVQEAVQKYDKERAKAQPYENQRRSQVFGESNDYGWSEDKIRQYSQAERKGFGEYARSRGFKLE